jgi:hypothetical protein
VPEEWRLLYNVEGAWRAVERPGSYGEEIDRFNEVEFVPVKTTALRVEVQLKPGFSVVYVSRKL